MMTKSRGMITFGNNVKSVLSARGMLAQDLAERLGMAPAYLSTILNANQNTTCKTMEQIADALEVPLHDLLNPKFEMVQNVA